MEYPGRWGTGVSIHTHSILLYSVCKHQSWIPQSVTTGGFFIAFYLFEKRSKS